MSKASGLVITWKLVFCFSAVLGIIAFLIVVMIYDLGDILFVGTVLSFSLHLTIFSLNIELFYCLAVGLSVISSDIVLIYGRASFPQFSFS